MEMSRNMEEGEGEQNKEKNPRCENHFGSTTPK